MHLRFQPLNHKKIIDGMERASLLATESPSSATVEANKDDIKFLRTGTGMASEQDIM